MNPMILLGIFGGIFAITNLKEEAIKGLFADYHFYLLVVLVSTVYTFVFKRVYKDGGVEVDYGATSLRAAGGVLKFLLAFALSMSFVLMISF